MYVTDTKDDSFHEVEVLEVTTDDRKRIKAGRQFTFDWSKSKTKEGMVYKLCLKSDKTILGLLYLIPHPEEGHQYLEVMLIEAAKQNRGDDKRFDRVGGCLLAFACRQSYITGCTGYVMLIAKAEKARLFHQKFGFKYIGSVGVLGERMVSEPENTNAIINEFYNDVIDFK